MRVALWITTAALPATMVVAGASSILPATDAAADHVRQHLDSVLVELRGTHPRSISDMQRLRRNRLIVELAAYRDRGAFPHNYDFPGQLAPYFQDRETGALCAVGDLLDFTGHTEIVDRVAKLDNNIRVTQLAGDTAFLRWLSANGLTLAEAARIQVMYVSPESPAQKIGTAVVGLGAPIAAIASAATVILNSKDNRDGHSGLSTTLGFVSGALSAGMGVALLHSSAVPVWPGAVVTSLGAMSIAASVHALHRHDVLVRDTKSAGSRAGVAVSLAPVFAAGDQAGVKPAAGAALSVRF
jgi:hypothetical protein